MKVFCLEDFKEEFEKLKKKRAYKTIEKDTISYFFNKKKEDLCSGTNLNNNLKIPYIKKRIGGSGGFRFYFLLILVKDSLYLMYVHPKTGPDGAANTTNEFRSELIKKIYKSIESNNLYSLTLNHSQTEILFSKIAVSKALP